MKRLIIGLVLLVTACVPVSALYNKAGATPQELAQDRAACKLQVAQLTKDNNADLLANGRSYMALCLEAHGWAKDTTKGVAP